ADEEVPRVVRKQVEQNVRVSPPVHDEGLLVGHARRETKRAIVFSWLLTVFDVHEAVGRPEPLESIRNPGEVRAALSVGEFVAVVAAHDYTCAFDSIASMI